MVKAGGGSGQLAERAFHPDEVRASGGQLAVDVEYYLANQVRTAGWPEGARAFEALQGSGQCA